MQPKPLPIKHSHAYIARINRVVDHISAHLTDILDLQTLAEVAHFSPWHFHRVFQGLTSSSPAQGKSRRGAYLVQR